MTSNGSIFLPPPLFSDIKIFKGARIGDIAYYTLDLN
jgi:hypothetical protein